MTTVCNVYPISDLEKACSSRTAIHLYDHWRRAIDAGDRNFDALTPFSPELLVLGHPGPHAPLSNLLFCGNKTMAANVFGSDWGIRASKERNAFSDDYSDVVSKSQATCFESNEAIYDYISTEVAGQSLAYERLLLPIRTKGGLNLLMCHSMPLSVPRVARS